MSTTTSADGVVFLNITGDAVSGVEASVTASKAGHDSQTRLVRVSPIALPLSTQSSSESSSSPQSASLGFDVSNNVFTLLYTLTVSQTRPALRSGETLTINVASVVPPASAGADRAGRIIATAADGTRTDFTQGATTGVSTAWSLPIAPPAGAAEGPVSLTVCAVNNSYAGTCAGSSPGSVLSLKPTVIYTIDDTAPALLAGRIRPLDGGNTMFASQRLHVPLTELGSGVDLGALRFDLTDETTATTTSYTGAQVSLDVTKKWAQTVPVSLVRGHLYRVAVTVTDLAGNQTVVAQAPINQGGGWLAMAVTAPGVTTASIPAVDCVVEPDPSIPNADAKKNATCSGMKVAVDPATVTLSATRHGGTGRITQTVPISSAVVVPSAIGGAGLLPVSPYATGTTRAVTQDYFTPDGSAVSVSATAEAAEIDLQPVTVRVPHGTTAAKLSMGNVASAPASIACQDAIAASVWCSPDPLPAAVALSGRTVLDVVSLPGGRMAAMLSGQAYAVGRQGSAYGRSFTVGDVIDGAFAFETETISKAPEPVTTESWMQTGEEAWRAGWRALSGNPVRNQAVPTFDPNVSFDVSVEEVLRNLETNRSSGGDGPHLTAPDGCEYENDGIPEKAKSWSSYFKQDGCWSAQFDKDSDDGNFTYIVHASSQQSYRTNELVTLVSAYSIHNYAAAAGVVIAGDPTDTRDDKSGGYECGSFRLEPYLEYEAPNKVKAGIQLGWDGARCPNLTEGRFIAKKFLVHWAGKWARDQVIGNIGADLSKKVKGTHSGFTYNQKAGGYVNCTLCRPEWVP